MPNMPSVLHSGLHMLHSMIVVFWKGKNQSDLFILITTQSVELILEKRSRYSTCWHFACRAPVTTTHQILWDKKTLILFHNAVPF